MNFLKVEIKDGRLAVTSPGAQSEGQTHLRCPNCGQWLSTIEELKDGEMVMSDFPVREMVCRQCETRERRVK